MRIRQMVTTRAGGVSQPPYDTYNFGDRVGDVPEAVFINRSRLAESIGLSERRLLWMRQMHGRRVAIVDDASPAITEPTDATVTATPGLALAVMAADCAPVLLADPRAGVVAAVHAGRAGAQLGIVPAAIDAMNSVGAQTKHIEALVGPAICGQCYEVSADMASDVEKSLPGSACRTRQGTPGLDIRAGLWRQLADIGIGKIDTDQRCTYEDESLFSYRRNGTTGCFAALTWVDPE